MAFGPSKKFATAHQHLRPIIVLLQYIGIWGLDTDNVALAKFYNVMSILLRWCCPYLSTFCQFIALFYVTNIADLTEAMFLMISFCNFNYKITLFFMHLKRTKELCLHSNHTIFQPRNFQEEKILNDTMKETKIHCAFFFFFALGVAVIFSILPIVQTEPRHPYSSWYPFEISSGVNFKMYATAVYEAICLLTMALLNVSTDVLIYSLIGIVHYQIQLLGLRLTQMGWNKSGFIGNFENGRSAHFTQVVECISLHWEIDRFVIEYHRLFNSIIFVQIVQSVIVFSMTTLRLMIIPFGSVPFVLNFLYLNVMASEVYEYCRFGNGLIYSSRNLSMNALCSNFLAFDLRTKKALLMFMQYSTRYEISITAVGVFKFPLSFATLLVIAKTSYSYVALMRSMD